jgi:acyl-CoA thioesterase-2
MDARTFLGMEPVGDELHWRMEVLPELATPGNFLFGGCGLASGLVALEAAAGRPTVWANAQYLSYAPTGSVVDIEVTLPAVGGSVTQGRAVASCEGREVLTVNASLGAPRMEIREVWEAPPSVPPPEECPPRRLPMNATERSILSSVDVRVASGERFEDLHPGDSPNSALWARVPGHVDPSAAMLAVFGDYVSGSASKPLGRMAWGRSLDNTLRMVQLAPTEWVLCDIRMHAVVGGYGQGIAFLWSESGTLLATASQSISIRFWDDVPAGNG